MVFRIITHIRGGWHVVPSLPRKKEKGIMSSEFWTLMKLLLEGYFCLWVLLFIGLGLHYLTKRRR